MAVVRPRSNILPEPLRWTVERASSEFHVAPVTLRKFLRPSGAEPDESGCFSTRQICEALYGEKIFKADSDMVRVFLEDPSPLVLG